MQLTAVEFAVLLRDLKGDPRANERRANPRAPAAKRIEVVFIIPGTPPVPTMLQVRDISRTGLGLVMDKPVNTGQRMLLLLPRSVNTTFVVLCEVVRVTPVPVDGFTVGVRMVRRVTEEERAAFMRGSADATGALLAESVAEAA